MPKITFEMHKENKLVALADDFGFEVDDLLEHAALDSVAPGICFSSECDYSTEVEPDCANGWCEECERCNVVSCLVLANII